MSRDRDAGVGFDYGGSNGNGDRDGDGEGGLPPSTCMFASVYVRRASYFHQIDPA